MRVDDKERIFVNTRKRYWWIRFKSGVKNLMTSHIHRIVLAVFLTALFILTYEEFISYSSVVSGTEYSLLLLTIWYGAPIALYAFTIAVAVIFLGTPKEYLRFRNELLRTGLTNSAGECPVLIAKHRDEKYPQAIVYEFLNLGVPMKEWEDKKAS